MSSKVSLLLATVPVGAIAAAAVVIPGGASGAAAPRAAKPVAPVIRETFTPLPCTGKPASRTTVQQEGCAEQQVLKTDRQIDAVVATIFKALGDDAARRRFVTAQRTWLTFRRADCASRSDIFEGGSQAPVVNVQCQATRNLQRLKDLKTFRSDLVSE